MWRMCAVMVVASACNGDRIDALEYETKELRAEVKALNDDNEALRKATGNQLADVAERLFKAGITDEKNENIVAWWCNGLTCARDLAACDIDKSGLASRGLKVRDSCIPQRVAWCRGDGVMTACMETVDQCRRVKGETERPNTCLGVE